MSEAEITEQMVMMMDLTLVGVSVFFSIVSAYVLALFYFLRRAPVGLRVTLFGFFSLTFAFLALFAANCFSHAASLQTALIALGEQSALSPVGLAATRHNLADRSTLDQAIRSMTWIGMGLVYAALAWFTFFQQWRERRAGE
ncbi:MAG: hypothetical protein HXY23_01375 [Parvularculaceae bacterium]|nr:hypothetical protein [Parvularculaceae bacterium]